MHICIHTYIHTHEHIHTYTHTQTHTHTHTRIHICIHISSLYSLPLLPVLPRSPPSRISPRMSTVEGSSEKRVLILRLYYSPTIGVHSVRQQHVGASRLSRIFVSDASGEGITCSCVAPCTLCTSCALGYGRTCLRPRSPCSRS